MITCYHHPILFKFTVYIHLKYNISTLFNGICTPVAVVIGGSGSHVIHVHVYKDHMACVMAMVQ